MNFGYILRHRSTREVCYFKPFEHEGMIERLTYIARHARLLRLESRIRDMNIMDNQRNDTKWVVELLTNVRFTVYKTNFLLGNDSELQSVPDFVKKHKVIYSFVNDSRFGKPRH